MGDSAEDAEPRVPRRDKPQTLDGVEATKTLNTEAAAEAVPSSARPARNRARTSRAGDEAAVGPDERKHSSDGSAGAGAGSGSSTDDSATPRRRESLNCDDTSPSGGMHGFGKALFGRSARYPASGVGGATTRKCVLTLDGYSYVIVASTPENLPKRDDHGSAAANSGGQASFSAANPAERRAAGGSGGGERSTANTPPTGIGVGGGGSGSSGAEGGGFALDSIGFADSGGGASGATTTINGQIAKHGSLTIVRRSNSRKSFSHFDAQQSILVSPSATSATATGAPGAAATTPSSATAAAFFQQQLVQQPHDPSGRSTNNNNSGPKLGATPTSRASALDNRATDASLPLGAQQQQPSSGDATAPAAATARSADARAATMPQPLSPDGNSLSSAPRPHVTFSDADPAASDSESVISGTSMPLNDAENEAQNELLESAIEGLTTSPSALELATENLPAVDTPDACDKAAERLRCLLRMLQQGAVAPELVQKNLHYAARVLEAVFIDESKSPTAGKSNSGQGASSAVDGEDQPDGNCKNLNCSQDSHASHATATTATTTTATTGTGAGGDDGGGGGTDGVGQDNNNSLGSNQQATTITIDGSSKGSTAAPQTPSEPTGPPASTAAVDAAAGSTETGGEATKRPSDESGATATAAAVGASEIGGENSSQSGRQSVDSHSSSSSSNNATTQRQRRLRTPVWARSMSTNKTMFVKEEHGLAIFGVAFNPWQSKEDDMLVATAGSKCCHVYQCLKKTGLKCILCFTDPDPDEVFYTCAWSFNSKTGVPVVATAGYRGVIRVIDLQSLEAVGNYVGHGQAINELKIHPRKHNLLLSGSKDHAIRLWNTDTHVCIAIFGGVEGHRDEVLSIDFDLSGERFISSGMDHSLKLWCINSPKFEEIIELSATFKASKTQLTFPTFMQHFPDFSTRDIHRNYVDCVRWFGHFVLSKSCENAIVCWKPGQLHQTFDQLKPNDPACTIITEFDFDECEIWFVRFDFNPWHKMLALGNQHGKVYIWELDPSDRRYTHASTLNHLRCTSTVRQVAFSRDASVLVCVCDDSTVWRWNRRCTEPQTP